MAELPEKPIGTVTHYFGHVGVGVIELNDSLKVGEGVRIKGHTTDFSQTITSMQIEHQPVPQAGAGQSVGVKVEQPVREGDLVFRA